MPFLSHYHHGMRRLLLLSALLLTACTAQVAPVGSGPYVERTIDGDTIEVRMEDGTKEKIRIIGIDTPETVDPRRPVGCFGKEASLRMKDLVLHQYVTLETNPAEDRDRYGRMLRYVLLNGDDIGASMVRDGYAFSYKKYPHPKLDLYNSYELEAKTFAKGMWGEVCDYAE